MTLYDPACYVLAQHFGDDYSEEELQQLASDFQDAAESFHSWRDERMEKSCSECGERKGIDGMFHKPTCSRVA